MRLDNVILSLTCSQHNVERFVVMLKTNLFVTGSKPAEVQNLHTSLSPNLMQYTPPILVWFMEETEVGISFLILFPL